MAVVALRCHWAYLVDNRVRRSKQACRFERLDKFDEETGEWCEVLAADRRAGSPETATARIDVTNWFARLGRRDRRIAQALCGRLFCGRRLCGRRSTRESI